MEQERNPLCNWLTIITTTSPIPSHPSTYILDTTFKSINLIEGLSDCRKLILCDGWNSVLEMEMKYFKTGIISNTLVEGYMKFIDNIKEKAKNKDEESDYKYTEIFTEDKHLGYSLNLKKGLELVTTPYVIIMQHDHIIKRNSIYSMMDVINCIESNSEIHYIGFLSSSDQNYLSKVSCDKEYNLFYNDLESIINEYYLKRNNNSQDDIANNILMTNNEEKENNENFNQVNFNSDKSNNKAIVSKEILKYTTMRYGLPLMPIVLWYDKPHIVKTSFYLEFMFNSNREGYSEQVNKVTGFIEATVGELQRKNIKKSGYSSFSLYGTFVLYDIPEVPMIMHTHGRGYLSDEDKEILKSKNIQSKKENLSFELIGNCDKL